MVARASTTARDDAKRAVTAGDKLGFQLGDDDSRLLRRLESELAIDVHALDDILQEHPELYYEVSKQATLLSSRRDAAKHYLQETEARIYLDRKRQARDEETKVSEKELEHMVNTHPEVLKQTDTLLRISNALGQFLALKEAFQQRSYVLKDLASLYIANYYGDISVAGDTSKIKGRDATIAKEAMSNKRRESNRRSA